MSRPRIFWSDASRVDAHDAAIARQRKHEERERQAAIPRKARLLAKLSLIAHPMPREEDARIAMACELLALLDGSSSKT